MVLDLLNYATKKESKDATGADKLVKVPSDLNNLKTKVDYFDVSKLKTVPVDLKKLIDIVKKLLKTQN